MASPGANVPIRSIRSRIRTALLLLALSTLAAALGLEAFLRVVRPVEYRNPEPVRPGDVWRELLHRRSAVPGLGYELAPGLEQVSHGAAIRTNSHGMRDDEPLPRETPGLLRIAAVGDSFTFGWGVPARDSYPEVLEGLLRQAAPRAGRPAEVLNFAVSGYSTFQEVLVVRHRVLGYDPDAIVLGYFLNDPETQPVQPLSAYFADTAWWQRSHLLRLVAQALHRRAVARVGGGDYYRYVHRDPDRWASVVDGFEELARLLEGKIPLIVVIFPEPRFADWEAYPYADLHRMVAQAALAAGLDVIDLLDHFPAYPPRRLRLARDDPHPSPLGHAVAARAILERLGSRYPELLAAPSTSPAPR